MNAPSPNSVPAVANDALLWALLGDELDVAALPRPAPVPNVVALEQHALEVKAQIERRLAVTVRPPARRAA